MADNDLIGFLNCQEFFDWFDDLSDKAISALRIVDQYFEEFVRLEVSKLLFQKEYMLLKQFALDFSNIVDVIKEKAETGTLEISDAQLQTMQSRAKELNQKKQKFEEHLAFSEMPPPGVYCGP